MEVKINTKEKFHVITILDEKLSANMKIVTKDLIETKSYYNILSQVLTKIYGRKLPEINLKSLSDVLNKDDIEEAVNAIVEDIVIDKINDVKQNDKELLNKLDLITKEMNELKKTNIILNEKIILLEKKEINQTPIEIQQNNDLTKDNEELNDLREMMTMYIGSNRIQQLKDSLKIKKFLVEDMEIQYKQKRIKIGSKTLQSIKNSIGNQNLKTTIVAKLRNTGTVVEDSVLFYDLLLKLGLNSETLFKSFNLIFINKDKQMTFNFDW